MKDLHEIERIKVGSLEWAIIQMRRGVKVTRKEWNESSYIEQNKLGKIVSNMGVICTGNINDLTGWEIYSESLDDLRKENNKLREKIKTLQEYVFELKNRIC